MSIALVTVNQYTCEKCGHVWITRHPGDLAPEVCPHRKCRSPYWNRPRKVKS